MSAQHSKIGLNAAILLMHYPLAAQSATGNSSTLMIAIITITLVLLLWAVMSLANNLMKVEAAKNGIDTIKENFSIIPGLSDFWASKKPSYAGDHQFISLSKGHNILLEGEAKGAVETISVNRFALQPSNFHGISPIPKVEVEVGQNIKAGDILFFDKKRPEIKYVSPVSGEITSIERGDKRAIASVQILADKKIEYKTVKAPDVDKTNREDLLSFMAENGLMAHINQRPFDRVPDLNIVPDNIFISTFDTAPLAPDLNIVVEGQHLAFQKGLDVLAKLTDGKIYMGLDGRGKKAPHNAFREAQNVVKTYFAGKHPCGNVGVQIHHTAPIRQGSSVWTVQVQDVITIGKMFLDGIYDASRIIAVTGAEISKPQYISTYLGASVEDILRHQTLTSDNIRVISGDVLSGKSASKDGFVNFQDDQITVVREGNEYEMFGWLVPVTPRPSVSNTFPNFLYPDHKFEAETNTHGEKRAFVLSGLYEEVLPMDIYPMHLMKSILNKDIEKMEGLGVTELTEEDIALCEFVCVSKTPMQQILREGLELMNEQS